MRMKPEADVRLSPSTMQRTRTFNSSRGSHMPNLVKIGEELRTFSSTTDSGIVTGMTRHSLRRIEMCDMHLVSVKGKDLRRATC